MSEKSDKFRLEFLPEFFESKFFLFLLLILELFKPTKDDLQETITQTNPHLDPDKTHPQYALLLIVAVDGIRKHMNLLAYLLLPPYFSLPSYTVLDEVKEVRIQDILDVYHSLSPFRAEYRLKLKQSMLIGVGRFSIASPQKGIIMTHIEDIIIPQYAVQSFFETITLAKFENKPCYQFRYFSGYPYLSVSILTETSFTTVASGSQDDLPWCAILNGRKYLVYSNIPNRALQYLQEFLIPIRERMFAKLRQSL